MVRKAIRSRQGHADQSDPVDGLSLCRRRPHPQTSRKQRAKSSFAAEPPTLKLPPVPKSIKNGKHYVVVEALFSSPVQGWGLLNWRAFIEAETGAVLYLRALTDGVTAWCSTVDPMTKTNNPANLPSAISATLDLLRDNVTLVDLGAPAGSAAHAESGRFVRPAGRQDGAVADRSDDDQPVQFRVCVAYGRLRRGQRVLPLRPLLPHRSRPRLRHRHLLRPHRVSVPGRSPRPGERDQRAMPGKRAGQRHRLRSVRAGRPGEPLRSASPATGAWCCTNSAATASSGTTWTRPISGSRIAPATASRRFSTTPTRKSLRPTASSRFPWVNIGRRHDRPVNGWGWGSANDNGGYGSEQILATCHFRLYRSIGGDSIYAPRRRFAARSAVYLILRGVGQLTPSTNPGNPLGWEQQLETADAGVWTSTNPAEVHAGGAYHKVIRWAFEKQGVFRAPGAAGDGGRQAAGG